MIFYLPVTRRNHAKPAPSLLLTKPSYRRTVATALEDFLELAKYGKAIHVMAMLMVGFGFLMVFVRRYGYGAVTALYIAGSIVIHLLHVS